MPVDYTRFQYFTIVLSDGSSTALMGPALLEEGDNRVVTEVRFGPPRSIAQEAPGAKYEPLLVQAMQRACTNKAKIQGEPILPDSIGLKPE